MSLQSYVKKNEMFSMPVKNSFSEVKNQVLNQIQQSNNEGDPIKEKPAVLEESRKNLLADVQEDEVREGEVKREGSLSSNECVLSEDDNELNSVLCPRQKPFKKTYFQINKNAHETSAMIKINQS